MPKPVPPDISKGTDGFFENFLCVSRELWSESHPGGILRSFYGLLAGAFGITKAGCLRVSFRGGKFTFQRENAGLERNHSVRGLPASVVEHFKDQISFVFHQTDEDPDGASLMECRGFSLMWTLLGQPRKGCLVCFWDVSSISAPSLHLQLVVRLLQHEYMWYNKLDKTQALLYLDELTGLFNYRYLDIALDSEIRRASRYHQNFCLLFIDLDDFKKVNDRFGHMAGSTVLKQTGAVLQEELREVDTIIRYGGDEYVVILLGADSELGVLVAERIRQRIAATVFEAEDQGIPLSCSIGVACFPEHGKTKEALLKMADDTMYTSKKKGKNRVTLVSDYISKGRESYTLST